jgi:hypothetical protein
MRDLQPKLKGVTLLTDPTMKATEAWGLRLAGAEHPSPGTFVVARDGTVMWRRLADAKNDWQSWDEVAAAVAGS